MTVVDPYSEFASVYDRWQWLHAAPFSTAMILRMEQALEEWGVPERSLLDLACGTGTLARWWSEEHPDWMIRGVDRSAEMIERARSGDGHRPFRGPGGETAHAVPATRGERAGKARTKPKTTKAPKTTPRDATDPVFEVQDITRLSTETRFGMVTCFFDSMNHITRRQDLSRLLVGARKSLLPNGLFLFDLIDEDNFEEIFSSPWIVQDDDLYVGSETQHFFRGDAEYGRVRYTFFGREPRERQPGRTGASRSGVGGGSHWARRDAEILERCWRREEFDPMVEDAGLEVIHVQLIDPEEQAEVFVPRRLYVCAPTR